MHSRFSRRISPSVEAEIHRANDAREHGDTVAEFAHLESAHVIGQESTYWHVAVHARMLVWGIRNRSPREVAGQLFRIAGAATKTFIGLVPSGNTGGTSVSPFRRMPISAEHQEMIDGAKSQI